MKTKYTLHYKNAAKLVLLVGASLCTLSPHSSATAGSAAAEQSQSLTPRQLEILRTVLNAEGFITKQLHSEFWSYVPQAVRDHAGAAQFQQMMAAPLTAGLRYQREHWLSVKASVNAKRVVKTHRYEDAKKGSLNASSGLGHGARAIRSIENGERMLAAAAEGKPVQTPSGLTYITPEVVQQVLSGLDASWARLNVLVNPSWEERAREYRYPEAHVNILSPIPFLLARERLSLENGSRVDAVLLSRRLTETDHLSVSFGRHGAAWKDPNGAAIRTVQKSLQSVGASGATVASSTWRNRVSASGVGRTQTSEGTLFIAARVVELRDLEGFMMLMAISGASTADAASLLEQLERSIQLLS